MVATNPHLLDYKDGWKRCMSIIYVNCDGFTVVLVEAYTTGVVNEYKHTGLL